jgi:hypothetical protein
MKYTVKAEKLEMTLQVDEGFVEALLGAIRAAKTVNSHKVYTPYPEESEFDFSAESAEMPEAAPPEPPAPVELDRTSKAYRKWYEFVLMWLRNFAQKGEQPERGEATRELSLRRDAGEIVSTIKRQGGLTHAVHEVLESAFAMQESARLDGTAEADRKVLARQVAENITQVSSIFFYDLCNLLEYHNPLEEEED